MAQTGFTPILTYGSTTASNTPSAGNLTTSASGVELAVNAADGKLFYKDSGGVVQVLATKGTGAIGGSNTQVQYNSSGSLAGSANLTFDGTTLTANALTTTSTVTINGGTANGVAYLNGSKVLTTGSALVFDGTNLGVGTSSPSSFSGYTTVSVNNATNGGIYNILVNGTETARLQAFSGIFNVAAKGAATNLTFETNGSERMRLDTSGNLGLGVTPSAWTVKAVEIGAKGTAIWNLNQQNASFTCNAYYDGTLRYGGTGLATQYQQAAGIHYWYTAASGTAGNAITFT